MKKILSILAVVGLFAYTAAADLKVTRFNGGTNNIAALTTNSYTAEAYIAVVKSDKMTVQISAVSAVATNVADMYVEFDASVDNSTWKTNAVRCTNTLNGTTIAISQTSVSTGATPFWRIGKMVNLSDANNAANRVTNVNVRISTKDGI